VTDPDSPELQSEGSRPIGEESNENWVCPNCHHQATGKFCNNCGEKKFHPHDLSLFHFLEVGFESFFHADSRLLSSLKLLVSRPGELTVAFVTGVRKKYIGPIQLFLLVNLIYFLIQSVTGWNTFSTPLQIHVTDFAYRDIAKSILDHHLAQTHVSYEDYEKVFNHAVRLHAKSLVIVMIPLFMIPVALLYWRRGPSLVYHTTFSMHFISFELLLLCVMQPLTSLVLTLLVHLGVHPQWQPVDNTLTFIGDVVQLVYLFIAARQVYRQPWLLIGIKTLLLVLCYAYVVLAFRFILFLVTIYST
jgi:hypothetical protein